ncbi:hypothetical protein [Desulfonema magnum]|uniref:Uncharacterized protein n=1 Tax=Desulfonema magnum TaxID=45655 RepID=A0A975GMU2_9BACT|nr:hypothetical protein [Desulfonema magnum]QTA86173.1 Uncharacterized protein dnm_021940 [Desulfonema magnum]
MRNDPIVERIREVRHKISEKHDHDTMRLIRHYQEMEKKTARRFFEREICENKKVA